MKTSTWLVPVFVIVAVGQLAIPTYMIRQQETTLREGRAYKFKTAPVDPCDAFRGRYVALRFDQSHAPWAGTNSVSRQRAYAHVEEGADGFAVVRDVSRQPPATGDFFKVQVNYSGWGTNTGQAYFTMPFDRYYLEETIAPQVERAYRDNNRRGQTNRTTFAVVRIRNGHAALENLFVGGQPVAEIGREAHRPAR